MKSQKRWMFIYHFPFAVVKYAHQRVIATGSKWYVAAAKADREVAKRKGIKSSRKQDMFKRSCYPIEEQEPLDEEFTPTG